jgi:hypothetical protein
MPKHRKKKSVRALEQDGRAALAQLRHQLLLAETNAAIAHGAARRMICSIARDLAAPAAALARRGRPRLLAVLAKIVGDPHLAPQPPPILTKRRR